MKTEYSESDILAAFSHNKHAINLAIIQPKGGVGKTTLSFNLASFAAELGLKVLLLDQDQSCNLTFRFMDEEQLSCHPNIEVLYRADAHDKETFLKIKPTRVKDYPDTNGLIDLLPSFPDLTFADQSNDPSILNRLKLWQIRLGLGRQYDLIISDNPGQFGTLCLSALMAANYYLSPLEMTNNGWNGIQRVNSYVQSIKEFNNPLLKELGYLPFKVRIKDKGYKAICDRLENDGYIDHLLNRLDSQVHQRASIQQAGDFENLPVWHFNQSDKGAREAGQNIREVMSVILAKLMGIDSNKTDEEV